jgi:hypothetical protein
LDEDANVVTGQRYAKGEKIDLTQDEKKALKKILGDIVEAYRRQ